MVAKTNFSFNFTVVLMIIILHVNTATISAAQTAERYPKKFVIFQIDEYGALFSAYDCSSEYPTCDRTSVKEQDSFHESGLVRPCVGGLSLR